MIDFIFMTITFIFCLEIIGIIFHKGFMKDENELTERLNRPCFSSRGAIHFWYFDFIARDYSIFSKWYIEGEGKIYRWSKLSKMIDEKYKSLRKTEETDIKTIKLMPKY